MVALYYCFYTLKCIKASEQKPFIQALYAQCMLLLSLPKYIKPYKKSWRGCRCSNESRKKKPTEQQNILILLLKHCRKIHTSEQSSSNSEIKLHAASIQIEISHHGSISLSDPLIKCPFMKSKWALNRKLVHGSTAKQDLKYHSKHQNKPHKDENQSDCTWYEPLRCFPKKIGFFSLFLIV